MTKLNQLLAVEKGVKSKAERVITDAHHSIQKPVLLAGLSRTYQPKDAEGDRLPSETSRVQLTVDGTIETVSDTLTRLFDVTATKEYANTKAVADVVVGNRTILKDAPVTFLLFLEKQLVALNTFIAKLPTLDPAEKWSYSPESGFWESEVAETTRTKKVPKNHVKAEATDKHPAQVELFHEDVVVGYWSAKKFSGAIPADRLKTLLRRVEELQEAVKFAREAANNLDVDNVHAGEAVFGYLFAE